MSKTYEELFPIEVKRQEIAKVFQSQIQKGVSFIPVIAAIEKDHLQKIRDTLTKVLSNPTDEEYVKILKTIEEVLLWLELFTESFKKQKDSPVLPENEGEALHHTTEELNRFKAQLMPAAQILFAKRVALYPHLERIFLETAQKMQDLTISKAQKIILDYEGLGEEKYSQILKTFQGFFSNLKKQSQKVTSFIQEHIFHWDAQVLKSARGLYIPREEDFPCSILFSAKGQAHLIFENVGQLLGSGADKVVMRIFSIPGGNIEAFIKPLWVEEEEEKSQERKKLRFDHIWQEIEILSKLKNKRGVVCLKEKMTFEIEGELTLLLIEDFYWDGNLWNYLKYPIELNLSSSRFSNSLLGELFTDLLAGLVSIHEQDFIHHDIKPDNILLDLQKEESKVAIADFQLAVSKKDQFRMSHVRCIPKWTAPELALVHVKHGLSLDDEDTEAFIIDYIAATSEKMDIWSMGLIFYCMATSKLPFWMQMEAIKLHNNKPLPFENFVNTIPADQLELFSLISNLDKSWFVEELKESPFLPLIARMLDPDPELRCTAKEGLQLLP